jgi:hypothetical protein
MTRDIIDIQEEIQAIFVANPIIQQLYGISGTVEFKDEFSLVSLESQLILIIATSGKTIEDLMDIHDAEVNARIEAMTPGTLNWYKSKSLAFQIEDELMFNQATLKYEYLEFDEEKQIVQLASVNETNTGLLIKVAKLVSNVPEALSPMELNAFIAYMEKVKYAGVFITYVSRPADLIQLNLKVYFDAMILASDGSLLTNSSKFPVADAVEEYLKLRPFNGMFNVTALIDTLQRVTGVVNPVFRSASARYGSQPWKNVTDYYLPNAGHMVIDTLTVEYAQL